MRDYGTATWDGGDPECDHKGPPKATQAGFNERYTGRAPAATDKQSETRVPFHSSGQVEQTKWKSANAAGAGGNASSGSACECEAWRGALGLEPMPEMYVAHMVDIAREIWRVLRPDGTFWLNLGDSYAAQGGDGFGKQGTTSQRVGRSNVREQRSGHVIPTGLKPKDLLGIPWLVAFALRADGWWLRKDIIWQKPNPMPESVEDRPTSSHEHIFLLAKSETYFYDADAVREEHEVPRAVGRFIVKTGDERADARRSGERTFPNPAGRNLRDVWTAPELLVRLRRDLSDDDRAYVLGELLARGL